MVKYFSYGIFIQGYSLLNFEKIKKPATWALIINVSYFLNENKKKQVCVLYCMLLYAVKRINGLRLV